MGGWLLDARRIVGAARELGVDGLEGASLPVALGALFAAVQHQVSLLSQEEAAVLVESYHSARADFSGEPCVCGDH